jgi:hypothetical protein
MKNIRFDLHTGETQMYHLKSRGATSVRGCRTREKDMRVFLIARKTKAGNNLFSI